MTEQTIAHKQKQLTKQVAAFAQPETKNSLIQLLNTFYSILRPVVSCLSQPRCLLSSYVSINGYCRRFSDKNFYHLP